MGKDPKKPEDLEVSPDRADEVKGGVLPPETGGKVARGLSVHKTKHHKPASGPLRGMGHE